MKRFTLLSSVAAMLFFTGCANREGVAPSQNSTLNAVSLSTAGSEQPGYMQRSMDAWLKEEWAPMTTTAPKNSNTQNSGSAQSAPAQNSAALPIPSIMPANEDPFTLQQYADKWKVYHETKAKMNEGKVKEPSHVEIMSTLPVVGK